jgi:hypothetical protein
MTMMMMTKLMLLFLLIHPEHILPLYDHNGLDTITRKNIH